MRRFLLILMVGLGAVACTIPYGEFEDISKIPGVEPGSGNNNYNEHTTYKGALLPEYGLYGESGMLETLKLIGEQNGEIDDARFVELLEAKIFDCERRFMYIHDLRGEEPDWWSDATEWVGGQMLYDLAAYSDGTFSQRYHLGCAFVGEEYSYLYELGHEGYSYRGVWRYDAESDMLYTSEDELYAAKVLYFDGECAVLEGYVYPMWLYEDRTGVNNYKRETPMELYYFTFKDGKESYLDGFELSYKEYMAIAKEYRETYMMFEGKLMPDHGAEKERMNECIALLSLQEAEDIDDAKFVDMLTSMVISCEDRFSTSSHLDSWISGDRTGIDTFGLVSRLGDMRAMEDGSCTIRTTIHNTNKKYEPLASAGCYGWYESGSWSYDTERNTLSMQRGDESYEAVLHYFDAETGDVVMRGSAGFVLHSDWEDEIFRCKLAYPPFMDYLGGYLSYDEFVELWDSL